VFYLQNQYLILKYFNSFPQPLQFLVLLEIYRKLEILCLPKVWFIHKKEKIQNQQKKKKKLDKKIQRKKIKKEKILKSPIEIRIHSYYERVYVKPEYPNQF
jgi:hypothetical protein